MRSEPAPEARTALSIVGRNPACPAPTATFGTPCSALPPRSASLSNDQKRTTPGATFRTSKSATAGIDSVGGSVGLTTPGGAAGAGACVTGVGAGGYAGVGVG